MKNLLIGAIILGGLGYGGAKLYLHHEVSGAMDQAVLMASPFAEIRYEGVSSTLSGELMVDGLQVLVEGYRDEIYIDRIGIDTPSFFTLLEISDLASMQSKGMPEYFGFIVEGLRIPVDADYFEDIYAFTLQARGGDYADDPAAQCTGRYGFSPQALSGLGYEDQVVSMALFVRDEPKHFLLDMTLNLQDMWDLEANVSLDGNVMSGLAMGAAYVPRLDDMRIAYTDRSLNERVARYCGQLGLSALETMQAQIDTFKYAGASNGIEFDEYMLDPYKEFLNGKSTLLVTAKPNEPIAFSQIDLYKPSDVPALLNLAAAAR